MAPPPAVIVSLAGVILLSGCITHDEGTGPNEPNEAYQAGNGVITHPYGNVLLTTSMPSLGAPGEAAAWDIQVRHGGPPSDEPFPYSSICHSPWHARLIDAADNPVTIRPPRPECEAYGTAHLRPGDELATTWEWNLTYWDEARAEYLPIQPGSYTLEFRFERQSPDQGRTDGPTAEHRFTVA